MGECEILTRPCERKVFGRCHLWCSTKDFSEKSAVFIGRRYRSLFFTAEDRKMNVPLRMRFEIDH